MLVLQVDDIAYQSINNVLAFTCKEELQSLEKHLVKDGSLWLILLQLGYWSVRLLTYAQVLWVHLSP